MDILVKIKPLYDELIKIGIPGFMKNNEFVRLCEEIGISHLACG